MTPPHTLPPVGAPPAVPPPAPPPDPSRPPSRDGFLDVVRAVAVVRVVVWHAFGAAALTYLVAAMPAMFFVSGSLFAGSARRRGTARTVTDRLRRIGPSLWVFAAVAWSVMAVAATATGTALPLRNAVLWFLPVADPSGSVWEGGWLAAPLWYLRTLLWVLLLSPVVLYAVRRRPTLALVAGLGLVAVAEGVHRATGSTNVTWQIGDVVLFTWFFAAGAVASGGGLDRVRRIHWLAVAGVAAVAATLWALTQPVPLGVVNNSHPMHLFVGVVWLALAMAAAPWLRNVASGPLAPVVRFVGQRSLTIYLWNTAAIAVVLWAMAGAGVPSSGAGVPLYLGAIAATVVVATVCFGWVEDLAARRRPRIWPHGGAASWSAMRTWRPTPAVLAAVASVGVVLAVSTTVAVTGHDPSSDVAFRPPVPSQAPPVPVIAGPGDDGADDGSDAGTAAVAYRDDLFATRPDGEALTALLDDWAEHHDMKGAVLAVGTPWAEPLVVANGVDVEGVARDPATPIEVQSVTKLFTANVVHRLAMVGLLDLDAPIPSLAVYPDFPYPQLTPRQLLAHRSGLPNYWDTPRYQDDPLSLASPLDAVWAVAQHPLDFETDTRSAYSSTNYLLLGLVVEEVVGVPFDVVLDALVLEPFALASVVHLPPEPGRPRGATGGIESTMGDLATAVAGLVREPFGFDDLAREQLFDLDAESGIGPGVNGFCPCVEDDEGRVQWFGIGYTGGSTVALHLPEADLVVALDLTETLWVDDHITAALQLLEDLTAFDWSVPVVDDGAEAVPA